jgi:hypothetical protein
MPRELLPSGGYYYYGKMTNTQSRKAYQSMGGVVSTHQSDLVEKPVEPDLDQTTEK